MQPLRTKALRKWRERGGDGGDNFFGFYLLPPCLSWGNDSEHFDVKRRRSSIFRSLGRSVMCEEWGLLTEFRAAADCLVPFVPLLTQTFTQEIHFLVTKAVHATNL